MRDARMLLGAVLLAARAAAAAPGALDPTFDGDGKARINVRLDVPHSAPVDVAIQPDGRIVTIGGSYDFMAARHETDGSLDVGFGTGGRTFADIDGSPAAVAIQADGKIVVAGRSRALSSQPYVFTLVRYDTNGKLDSTFGAGGVVRTPVGFGSSQTAAMALAVQPDGRLVAAGRFQGSRTDVGLVRYNPDGSLDATFGTAGQVITAVGTSAHADGIALQPDGKIVVAGTTWVASQSDFLVLRYDPAGALDPSFGSGGKVISDFGPGDTAVAVALLGDGSIAVGGRTVGAGFSLARYDQSGVLDPSFGSGGLVASSLGSTFGAMRALAAQSDGMIVMGGYLPVDGGANLALARFANDGSLDPSFGNGGVVVFDIDVDEDLAGLALQPGGEIIAAAATAPARVAIEYRVALARFGTNGALEPGFGANGIAITKLGASDDHARAIALQPTGKIVVAGTADGTAERRAGLVRLNPDGSLDPGFGVGGRLVVGDAEYTSTTAVAQQSDGKLVVAGYTRDAASQFHLALWRYDADGAIDATFGTAGVVVTTVGTYAAAGTIVLQPDGKMVVAGTVESGANRDFLIARYNHDGTLDTTFSADGIVTTAIGTGHDYTTAVALQEDGKIVVAGFTAAGGANDIALARYHPDGSLDASFDGDGKLTTAIGTGDDRAYALALLPDGRILVAGWAAAGGSEDFALVRYNPNGSLDTTFDGDGKVTTAIGTSNDHAYALVLQTDGKVILGGEALEANVNRFALARYHADGSLDATFHGDGKLTTTLSPSPTSGPNGDVVRALAIDADGRLVAVGGSSRWGGALGNFGVARYLLSECGDGHVGPGESCEDGNFLAGDCCSPDCRFEPAATPCADDGVVCTTDLCDATGQCLHSPGNSGAICRPAGGDCDVAEMCSGDSASCPPDAFAPPTTACRPSAGACDLAESCTGASPDCPADAKSSQVCRPAAAACDAAESCDGTGDDCPPDLAAAAGLECRAAAGICDLAETCDGASLACPADGFVTAGAPCRPATGACDVAEECTGSSPSCPADRSAPDGTSCSDGAFCNGAESCLQGACTSAQPPCAGTCDESNQACTSCPVVPRTDCRGAERESLVLRERSDGRHRLVWRWHHGAATSPEELADPRADAAYALCVYEGAGDRLASQLWVTPSADRWRALGAGGVRGFAYRDPQALDGAKVMTLRPGADGDARIAVTAEGESLPDPMLPVDLPVRVQLYNSASGACWSGELTAARRNDAAILRAERR